MIETNNPAIDVNELMDKVRAEVEKRSIDNIRVVKTATQKLLFDTLDLKLLNIQALINNAEARSQVRTKWPDKLNKFPLNISKNFQNILLKLLNFFFKEQRVVNISLVQAGQESLAINRELIKQIVSLQTQIGNLEVRLNNIENRGRNVETCVNNLENHGQNIDTCINTTNERLNILEQERRYIKNELGQQKSQVAMFIETANQRLHENLSFEQVQKLTEENKHSVDTIYVAFEDRFRGKSAEISDRLKIYLPILADANIGAKSMPILDLGCGRGEWLDLLREAGHTARGVDINRVMVEQSTDKQLEAIEADAITYLQSLPNNCLGAVTGFHIIEHLSLQTLINLISETVRVLKPGGLAIFETPNPKNLVVGACNFYSDPTHKSPIFPETIQFFLQYQGLTDVQLLYLNPVADSPFKEIDPKWDILNNWFFGARDYAVIGHKI